ncbi:MAG: hypothetical protein MK212_15790 [Saprospiraceae bacterium]|nr:hypothetical protein [Saprospiraceae bacterium]
MFDNYNYNPKKIWYKGYGGSKHGVYYIYALVVKASNDALDKAHQTSLFTFSFHPHKERKDLHVSNHIDTDIPKPLKSMLVFFVEQLLSHPSRWKQGERKVYFSQHLLGQFHIEEGFCYVPKQYKDLLLLPRKEFEELVDKTHPLFKAVNNNLQSFEGY